MIRSLLILSAVALVLSGCGAATYSLHSVDEKRLAAHLQDKPEELHPLFTRVVAEGERNHVLNRLRAGLAAMDLGYDALAARTFDEALLIIETIYGGDEKAAKARGLFSAEDRKVFRGEPYERAMAYYYRGILYLKEGDYENARASFKSGILQDTLAEQEEYRQDFALLEYLEGWASQCNGDMDLAREAYALAKSHDRRLVVPDAEDDLLVLADLGHAPVKYAAGGHGELLKIKASDKGGPNSASIRLNGRSEPLVNGESILRQAVTRGGREFDSVLAGKVNFKESAEDVAEAGAVVSTAAIGAVSFAAGQGDWDAAGAMAGVGAIAGMVSMFAGAASSATETAADTRQWDNLPGKVAYGTYHLSGAASRPEISFAAPANARPTHRGGDEACVVVWARSQDGASVDDIWERVAGKTFRGDADFNLRATGGGLINSLAYSFDSRDKIFHDQDIEISFSRSGKYTPITVAGDLYRGGRFFVNDWFAEDGRVILREFGKIAMPAEITGYGVGEFRENVLVVRGKILMKDTDIIFRNLGDMSTNTDFIVRLEAIEQ